MQVELLVVEVKTEKIKNAAPMLPTPNPHRSSWRPLKAVLRQFRCESERVLMPRPGHYGAGPPGLGDLVSKPWFWAAMLLLVVWLAFRPRGRTPRRVARGRRSRDGRDAKRRRVQLSPAQRYLEKRGDPKPKVLLASETVFRGRDPDSGGAVVAAEDQDTLRRLVDACDVYILYQEVKSEVTDAELARRAADGLKRAGISGFRSHRVIVCSTTEGRAHIARQVLPRLYADVVAAAVVKVAEFISDPILVVDSARVESRGKVREVPSIAAYFDRFGGARKDAKSRSTVDGKVSSRPAARGVVTGAVEGAAEGAAGATPVRVADSGTMRRRHQVAPSATAAVAAATAAPPS